MFVIGAGGVVVVDVDVVVGAEINGNASNKHYFGKVNVLHPIRVANFKCLLYRFKANQRMYPAFYILLHRALHLP